MRLGVTLVVNLRAHRKSQTTPSKKKRDSVATVPISIDAESAEDAAVVIYRTLDLIDLAIHLDDNVAGRGSRHARPQQLVPRAL